MSRRPGTVAVIGSINVDLLVMVDTLPRAGETVLGSGGTLSPGGKGANQALAAARQGADVTLVGAVGQDANAAAAIALLRDAGVNLNLVAAVDGPTGLAVVSVDREAENSIVVIPGANESVNPAAVAHALPRLATCHVVVLQGELPVATVEFTIEQLRGAPARVLLNLAPVIPLSAASIRSADVLVVNEHEAVGALHLLAGGTAEYAALPSPDVRDADAVHTGLFLAESLVAAGVAAAVVTLGSQGAVIAAPDGSGHIPPVAVDAVDTTGAGDAFVGAVAAGLAEGRTLPEAATLAVAVAAQSVQNFGAQQSYPWREGVGPARH